MKTKWILIASIFLLLSGCEKFDIDNPVVETYINLLKSNQYNYNDLPAFESKDIPDLLKYANDNQIITIYPHNPISSYIGENPRLGIFVLWTVESIRLSPNGPLGRFPSMSPTLWLKGAIRPADVNVVHPLASQAYHDWWNSNNNFEQIKLINPLENSDFSWR